MSFNRKSVGIHFLHGLTLYLLAAITLSSLSFLRIIYIRHPYEVIGGAFVVVVVYYLARLFVCTYKRFNSKPELSIERSVDPIREVERHIEWLNSKRRHFLRRNDEDATAAAIILGGLKLAQRRAQSSGSPSPIIPEPIRKLYQHHFRGWESHTIVRFADQVSAHLVDEPTGHIAYRKFAQSVLTDWQLKAMLDSIDKYTPESTKFIWGGVD